MADRTVSVVIPTSNRFVNLQAALASVTAQTHRNLEVIVVNDGSTDARYDAYRPEGIVWVDLPVPTKVSCRRPCPGHARNAGLALATGDLVAFLDDDDAWLPEKLARQLSAMEQGSWRMSCTEGLMGDGPMVPGARYPVYHREFYESFCVSLYEETGRVWKGRLPDVFTRELIADHNFIITSSVVVERQLLHETGAFKCVPIGQEDYDLWLRCLDHVDCLHLNEPLTYYDGRLAKRKRDAMFHRRALRGLRKLGRAATHLTSGDSSVPAKARVARRDRARTTR